MKEYTFNIPSMHDENSAKEVRSVIIGLRGVEDVNINYEDGIVNVFYDENQVIVDKIKYAVKNKGYAVNRP